MNRAVARHACALRKIVSGGARQGVLVGDQQNLVHSPANDSMNCRHHAEAAGVKIDFLPIHCEAKGRGTMKMRIDTRMQRDQRPSAQG